jgi:hypothetical protein
MNAIIRCPACSKVIASRFALHDCNARKPSKLTARQVANGGLSTWAEQYACFLAGLPSFQNMTERARFGRLKAIRALRKAIDQMLPTFSDAERTRLADDIRQTAQLKAQSDYCL